MGRLQQFTAGVEAALGSSTSEAAILQATAAAMRDLVAADDWLAAEFTVPHAQHYQQFLLHADPQDRFSVVSFVWGPGQKTPIHDHTVWGVIGMLRGSEVSQGFVQTPNGMSASDAPETLQPGDVAMVSPRIGDIHQVSNTFDDRVSISIHVYGANIGKVRRHVFDPATGAEKEFVSGYANVKAASA